MTSLTSAGERALIEIADQPLQVPWLEQYWNDPAFRAAADRETQENRDRLNAAIDAGMAGLNARQRERWEREA